MARIALSGTVNPALASALAAEASIELGGVRREIFPDGEMGLTLQQSVRALDVVLVQPLTAPVGEALLEVSLLADACHRSGAKTVTAVIPYLAYARQDRRETAGEPLGSRVLADVLSASRLSRVVLLDLHSRAVEGCFSVPVEHVSVLPALAEALKADLPVQSVVVSPDVGGIKRAELVASVLKLPVAVVHKQRTSGSQVQTHGVVGDVKGKHVVLVDDIIATAGTLSAAASAVLAQGAQSQVTVVASHGLFVGQAIERIAQLPLRRLLVSDSVKQRAQVHPALEVVSCASVLTEALRRLLD
jgi:ribose-phosphate pyrophosphokinase